MTLTKTQFRKKCLQTTRKLPLYNKVYRTKMINKRLLKELQNVKNKRILFYYPLEFEADIRQTLQIVRKKCEICLPFMQGESFKMVTFRLPLKKGRFGILEAGKSLKNIKNIDIAIVPVVGVDKNMQRVGFGKGMYDRFFAKLKKKPYTIFIQSNLCYTKDALCDGYDIDCDLLLTPTTRLLNKTRK
jgi:5-formyltetrahydrofolate cyclo-ligase